MRKSVCFMLVLIGLITSCKKETDIERAIAIVESQYERNEQQLDFDQATLDSLYTISPKAYADSILKGNELDSVLAVLESQIEHFNQRESDSVGLISAELTKQRYRLLDLAKTKPRFIGWKLSGVKVEGLKSEVLSFNFDKAITRIVK